MTSNHYKYNPAPSEQNRSQAATNDTFSTAKDMLMAKMLNKDDASKKSSTNIIREKSNEKGGRETP